MKAITSIILLSLSFIGSAIYYHQSPTGDMIITKLGAIMFIAAIVITALILYLVLLGLFTVGSSIIKN